MTDTNRVSSRAGPGGRIRPVLTSKKQIAVPDKEISAHDQTMSVRDQPQHGISVGMTAEQIDQIDVTGRTSAPNASEIDQHPHHVSPEPQGAVEGIIDPTADNLNEMVRVMEARTRELEDATVELNGTTARLNGTTAQLNGTIDKLNGTNAQLNNTVDRLNETIDYLEGIINDLRGTLHDLRGTIHDLGGTIDDLSGTVDELKGTIKDLKTLHEQDDNITELNHRITNVKDMFSNIKGRISRINEKVQAALGQGIDRANMAISFHKRNDEEKRKTLDEKITSERQKPENEHEEMNSRQEVVNFIIIVAIAYACWKFQ